jgi:ribosome-associated protein
MAQVDGWDEGRRCVGLTKPEQPNEDFEDIRITPELAIPADELRFRFSRSSGPGGQHVNRSETRVELLFDVANSPSLSEPQRTLLMQRLVHHMDTNGVIRIVSSTTRSQRENREAAIARFRALLAGALRERRKRVPTRPSRAAREQRLADKRLRGAVKANRSRLGHSDE